MKEHVFSFLSSVLGNDATKKESARDWCGLDAYEQANQALPITLDDQNKVVFMGDSITLGWVQARPSFWKNASYINRGINGQTTPQILLRLRQDVIALSPQVVIILAGTNDIAENAGPTRLTTIFEHIRSMAELAVFNQIRVVLCSILPVSKYPWNPEVEEPSKKIMALNTMLNTYAMEKNWFIWTITVH